MIQNKITKIYTGKSVAVLYTKTNIETNSLGWGWAWRCSNEGQKESEDHLLESRSSGATGGPWLTHRDGRREEHWVCSKVWRSPQGMEAGRKERDLQTVCSRDVDDSTMDFLIFHFSCSSPIPVLSPLSVNAGCSEPIDWRTRKLTIAPVSYTPHQHVLMEAI